MSRKSLLAVPLALLLGGCASLRPPTEPTAPPPQQPTASLREVAAPAPKPTPRPIPRPAAKPTPFPARTPANQETIQGSVLRDGDALIITRGAATPVPLFRQAIVLANVRAAVAGLPAQPKAEFQRGLLTLTFPAGTKPDVVSEINRALAVPEVTRLRANLPQ